MIYFKEHNKISSKESRHQSLVQEEPDEFNHLWIWRPGAQAWGTTHVTEICCQDEDEDDEDEMQCSFAVRRAILRNICSAGDQIPASTAEQEVMFRSCKPT